MTKTKLQLRAEAVERLMKGRYDTVADTFCDALGFGHEPHTGEDYRDALIDLLTDDESPEGDPVELLRRYANFWSLSHSTYTQCGSSWEKDTMDALANMIERDYVRRDDCETECYECSRLAELVAENSQLRVKVDAHSKAHSKTEPLLTEQSESLSDETESRVITSHNELFEALEEREADSREKLEADAGELTADYASSGGVCDALYCGIIDLLDRQAAITEHEVSDEMPFTRYKTKALQAKVDELAAENTALRVANGGKGCENPPETPEFAEIPQKTGEQGAEITSNDSREKLEADIRKRFPVLWEAVLLFCDRQAAITAREVHDDIDLAEIGDAKALNEGFRLFGMTLEDINSLRKDNAELQAKVDELERENSRLSSDELLHRVKVDTLRRDLPYYRKAIAQMHALLDGCAIVDEKGEVIS